MKLLPAIFLGLFILFTSVASSQDLFSSGARFQSLAGASVGLSGCWSVFGNQAGLAQITRTEVAGSFQSRFLVNELSTRSGILVFPIQSSVFAVSLSQFGKNIFRQEKLGLSYARQLFPKLNFGIQFNYYRLFLSEENRNVGAAGIELGAQYLFSKQLILGFHLLNPYQTGIRTLTENFWYPSRLNLGAKFQLSDLFSVYSELENDWKKHYVVKTAMEYSIFDKFFLRAGFSGKPYQFSAGIGFKLKKLTVDLASSYHQYLGDSPALSFQYQF
jgi:hypothetical protein